MQQAFGLNIPQTLEDICDPTRLALVVHDMHSGSRSLNPLRLRRGTHSVVRERPACHSKNARMVSARSETANTKPAFRDALKSCSRLIAAGAIYWGCALENKAAVLFRGERRRFVRVHWNQGPLERHHFFPLSS